MKKTLFIAAALLAVAALQARAQLSPDLIMESYNSNIQVITSGIINKSVLDKAVARNASSAGRSTATKRSTAATRSAAGASTAYTPTAALR